MLAYKLALQVLELWPQSADFTCESLRFTIPVGPHYPSALAYTRRIRDHARVGVRHRSASGRRAERSLGRRGVEETDGVWATRRDGGTGQPDVSEQSERWRLIDWFVGGRIISRTRTAPTHLMHAWSARSWHRFVYVYHGQYERPRPRAEISNVAMSTVLTKARRVVASDGTVGRLRGGGGAGPRGRRRRKRRRRVAPWPSCLTSEPLKRTAEIKELGGI